MFDATIEAPITIRNPDKPIGTHVFTAMARNDAGLRWTAVAIDNGDDAKDALDRITIPQDVRDRIAPTALPRSSIIISDEPLSRETNYRTEFVAVLNNQPQGGFLMRRLLPTCLYASARRPILSTDTTALVVRRGTTRVGRTVDRSSRASEKRRTRGLAPCPRSTARKTSDRPSSPLQCSLRASERVRLCAIAAALMLLLPVLQPG